MKKSKNKKGLKKGSNFLNGKKKTYIFAHILYTSNFFIVLLYVCTHNLKYVCVFYIRNLKKSHYLQSDIRRMQSEVSCLHFML